MRDLKTDADCRDKDFQRILHIPKFGCVAANVVAEASKDFSTDHFNAVGLLYNSCNYAETLSLVPILEFLGPKLCLHLCSSSNYCCNTCL